MNATDSTKTCLIILALGLRLLVLQHRQQGVCPIVDKQMRWMAELVGMKKKWEDHLKAEEAVVTTTAPATATKSSNPGVK